MRLIDADNLKYKEIWTTNKDKKDNWRRTRTVVVLGKDIMKQRSVHAIPVWWIRNLASSSNTDAKEKVLLNQLVRLWEFQQEKEEKKNDQ